MIIIFRSLSTYAYLYLVEVELIDANTDSTLGGIILPAEKTDMPLKKNGWKFPWKQLYNIEGTNYYKLCLKENASEIQGLIILTLMRHEMLYINNIEVAPGIATFYWTQS